MSVYSFKYTSNFYTQLIKRRNYCSSCRKLNYIQFPIPALLQPSYIFLCELKNYTDCIIYDWFMHNICTGHYLEPCQGTCVCHVVFLLLTFAFRENLSVFLLVFLIMYNIFIMENLNNAILWSK